MVSTILLPRCSEVVTWLVKVFTIRKKAETGKSCEGVAAPLPGSHVLLSLGSSLKCLPMRCALSRVLIKASFPDLQNGFKRRSVGREGLSFSHSSLSHTDQMVLLGSSNQQPVAQQAHPLLPPPRPSLFPSEFSI